MASGDKFKGKSVPTQFSSTNQPTNRAKREGKKKAKLIKEIASQIVKGGVKKALIPLAEYLGLDPDEINLETVMHLKQMEKAINDGDTNAYNAVMNRIAGKAKEFIDHTTNGENIQPTNIINLGQGKAPNETN
jgi:hypothetical protein